MGEGQESDAQSYKSCLVWVPRGCAAPAPTTSQNLNFSKLDAATIQQSHSSTKPHNRSPGDELDLENYDNEVMDESTLVGGLSKEDIDVATRPDPLLKDTPDSEDELEDDANMIKKSDYVLVAGSIAKGDENALETYVYDHSEQSLYVHHDTMLEFMPLSVDWVGNYKDHVGRHLLAVATYSPIIEIWDNDDPESLEPVDYLGKDSKKCHGDSITCLRANRIQTNVLASASADQHIRLWDLTAGRASEKIKWHSDVVSSIRWHPCESSVLASCGQDSWVRLGDVRQPKETRGCLLENKVEGLTWNRHNLFQLMAVTANGRFIGMDVRNMPSNHEKLLWDIEASEEELTDISDSLVPGMIITCGVGGVASVWDIRGDAPIARLHRDLKAGPLFCVAPCEDMETPTLLSFGGREIVVWDVLDTDSLVNNFQL